MNRLASAAADALQANGVPAGMVQDAGDLTVDPQLLARHFWRRTDHVVFGERPYDRFPALWSDTDLEPYVLSGGYIGEANFDVYRELAGLDEETIATGMGDGLFT
jgi:crotonobetainyl-CoA:carnitine CoA-transferase CaiB-like acyl-CoA transferase